MYESSNPIVRTFANPLGDEGFRVKRYNSSDALHTWHVDSSSLANAHRVIAVLLYLNDVPVGGETIFLRHNTSIKPERGNLLLFPATWTHVHRAAPPIKGRKYVVSNFITY
jgi:hypothetical protein